MGILSRFVRLLKGKKDKSRRHNNTTKPSVPVQLETTKIQVHPEAQNSNGEGVAEAFHGEISPKKSPLKAVVDVETATQAADNNYLE